jgi:hypothetical protein
MRKLLIRDFTESLSFSPSLRSNSTASLSLASPMPVTKPLGSYLIDAGLITPGQIEVALNDQQVMDGGMRFGEILVTRGWIKQQTLDYLILKVVDPEQTAAQQTPKPVAPVRRAAPGRATGPAEAGRTTASGRPAVATAQPLDALGSPVVVVFDQPAPAAAAAAPGRDTDSNHPLNVRKPLVSLTDEDGVSWAG